MTKEERIKIYDEATKIWGLVAQYDQCVEEMAELTVAINKYKRKIIYAQYDDNQKIVENLIEEVADVQMCLEQICHFFKDIDVEKVLDKKMQKFKSQIEEAKRKS